MDGGVFRARGGKSMREKLAAELLDASNNTGAAVKKREDVHRMAEAKRHSRTIAGSVKVLCCSWAMLRSQVVIVSQRLGRLRHRYF